MLNVRLKELRKRNKITQEQLAQIIGVERSSVGKYESPNKPVIPSSDIIMRIADYFNVTTDYLMGREESSRLTKRDEKEITEIMEQYKNQLLTTDGLMFDGEPVTEEDMRFILSALQASMETIKIKNKEKFTPKKYRK